MVKHIRRADEGSQRQSTAQSLAKTDDVGTEPLMLEAMQPAGPAEPDFDFVANSEDAMMAAK